MSAVALISRLDGVKRTGPGRWLALCPGHADRSPSLSIRETDDGRILLHDFAGCSVEEILGAVGLEFDALFPEREIVDHVPRERRPFLPADVFEIVQREVGVVAIIAADLHKAREVSDSDFERILFVGCLLRLPSHVAGTIGTTSLKRSDVIYNVPRTSAGGSIWRWSGIPVLELGMSRWTGLDVSVRVPRHRRI